MIVKITDAIGVMGGKSVALCDDNGAPLPCQIETTVTAAAGEGYPTITVTFSIDGKSIRLA